MKAHKPYILCSSCRIVTSVYYVVGMFLTDKDEHRYTKTGGCDGNGFQGSVLYEASINGLICNHA